MTDRKKRGDSGEAAIARYLEERNYQVLERQYRCRWGEIDLIVRTGDGILCFVEVKTRSPRAIAPPREAVTAAKQRRLRDAASWYLAQTGWDGPCRFDVAEVREERGRLLISYLEDAFQ